ncbi:alpha-amylase family glycosyl hydrolase [Planococcus glaciei]|uniref:alpha-amylase family glycosyl hydrolase n=1 Tax=Planococcus glaciei TaxID=459472 RepID=UPI001C737BFB|nr:alpha-amylase family glycosyl hydrolase [Planococcus glaciei]MBX0313522.1 alpha-amylase [Planococcus glaciei]
MKAKWIGSVLIGMLALGMVQPAAAEETKTIEDEIIYDVLVDRYFNKSIQNDYDVNAQDPADFSGGDFAGVVDQVLYVKEMGFTVLSIGPVFSSATYDGKQVLDYNKFERHFGTKEEFKTLLEEVHDQDIKVMVDVPTQNLSKDHTWAVENPEWFEENEDGTLALDTANSDVQEALIETFSKFVQEYEVDGLKLQNADQLDAGFIKDFSKAIKEIRNIYLINDVEMELVEGLDAVVLPGAEEALRNSYKQFDQGSSDVPAVMEESAGHLIRVDSLLGSRFTADIVAERGFPPTRWRLMATQLLTMPGIPIVQYGTETAMNGEALLESHQILNMAVDEELIDHITNLTTLRNSSAALRTGDTEVLHEEDGWLVYKRFNDEESWIVAINNTSSTQSVTLPADIIGSDKELQGLFESDRVRQEANGEYRISLERELAETYHVTDETGFNKAYIAALAVLYIVFMIFLWVVWRKGKQRKADEAAKNKE